MLNIAVLVSGGGTNLQALIDAERSGKISSGRIVLVVASNRKAYALERAKAAGIAGEVVSKKELGSQEAFDQRLLELLEAHSIDLVVLAGYLSILSPQIIARYPRRILNIHPSLIPSFCGDGFYGLRVHQAALDYGVKVRSAAVCSSLNPTGQNTAPAVPPEFTGDRKQKVNGKGGLVWTVRG